MNVTNLHEMIASGARRINGKNVFVGNLTGADLMNLGLMNKQEGRLMSASRHLVALELTKEGTIARYVTLEPLPTDVKDGKIDWSARFQRGARLLGE